MTYLCLRVCNKSSNVQLLAVINRLGVRNLPLPIIFPGGIPTMGQIAPALTAKDEKAVDNVMQLTNFLTGGSAGDLGMSAISPSMAQEVGCTYQWLASSVKIIA